MSTYDPFAPIYANWSAHMTDDVDFYVSLAEEADEPIVELAVGTGRIAVPVAARTGKRVIGIDVSPAMLELGRKAAAEAGVSDLVDFRLGDMRDLELDEPVSLVMCPFRSLLHLPTWADKRRVFERVAANLRAGGRFAWNAFVFHHQIAAEIEGDWRVQNGIRHRVDYAPGDNRVDIALDSGPRISLWWATRSEWAGLLDASGLETEALYGSFDRSPFDDASEEFVWVARKA
jgi:SAM-dependent methyltransferase